MLDSTRSPTLRHPSAIFSARAEPGSLLAASLPGSIAWKSALDSYAVAIAIVRDEGLTRRRQTDATERFFALCFALEQMRRNLRDLIRRVAEWARSPGQMSYATAYTGD